MTETVEKENIAQTIAKEIKKPFDIVNRDNAAIIAVPPGWKTEEHDFKHLLPQPRRKKGRITLTDTESFVDYVTAHQIAGQTNIYCEADYESDKVAFGAVINDHANNSDGQQWRDHTAQYKPEKSVEWKRWTGKDGETFNQAEFATFIEDNLTDIAKVDGMPTHSELYEMVINFEATMDSRFKQKIRLQSGAIELNFIDKEDEQTVQKMKMFEKISIGIPVFHGDKELYRIDARLKYRIREGKLTFWYELIRPDKVLEAATEQMISTIKTGTGVPFYFGDPNL